MNTNSNRNILSNSKRFPKLAAFWKLFIEYTIDYFSGQKYKVCSEIKEEKQK